MRVHVLFGDCEIACSAHETFFNLMFVYFFLTLGSLSSGFAFRHSFLVRVLGSGDFVRRYTRESSLHHLQNSTVRHIVKTETAELKEYITV